MAFTPGQSGNPTGRPKGTPDRRTELRGLFAPHAEKLIEKAVNLALSGDTTALRLCLDRICPALKPQAEPISLDTTGTDVTTLAAEVFRAATAGELALDEAAVLTTMLLTRARISDADEANRDIKEATRRIQALNNDMNVLEIERLDRLLKAEIKYNCASCTKKRR
jgi:hypothetical protein